MNKVMCIARASIREHSRRKIIVSFTAITLAVTAAEIAFVLKFGDGGSDLGLLSLVSVGLFGTLAPIAAFAVSMGNIGPPFSDGEAALILARPIARWQYVLGRVVASVGLVAALCLLMAVETQGVRIANGDPMSLALWGHWAVQAYNLTILASITTLMSVFAPSPVIAAVLAFLVTRFSSAVEVLHRMSEIGGPQSALASATRVARFLTPKMLNSPLVLGGMGGAVRDSAEDLLQAQNSLGLVTWSIGYLLLIVFITIILARRKEVKG